MGNVLWPKRLVHLILLSCTHLCTHLERYFRTFISFIAQRNLLQSQSSSLLLYGNAPLCECPGGRGPGYQVLQVTRASVMCSRMGPWNMQTDEEPLLPFSMGSSVPAAQDNTCLNRTNAHSRSSGWMCHTLRCSQETALIGEGGKHKTEREHTHACQQIPNTTASKTKSSLSACCFPVWEHRFLNTWLSWWVTPWSNVLFEIRPKSCALWCQHSLQPLFLGVEVRHFLIVLLFRPQSPLRSFLWAVCSVC